MRKGASRGYAYDSTIRRTMLGSSSDSKVGSRIKTSIKEVDNRITQLQAAGEFAKRLLGAVRDPRHMRAKMRARATTSPSSSPPSRMSNQYHRLPSTRATTRT